MLTRRFGQFEMRNPRFGTVEQLLCRPPRSERPGAMGSRQMSPFNNHTYSCTKPPRPVWLVGKQAAGVGAHRTLRFLIANQPGQNGHHTPYYDRPHHDGGQQIPDMLSATVFGSQRAPSPVRQQPFARPWRGRDGTQALVHRALRPAWNPVHQAEARRYRRSRPVPRGTPTLAGRRKHPCYSCIGHTPPQPFTATRLTTVGTLKLQS
jgi:hypothetical protein